MAEMKVLQMIAVVSARDQWENLIRTDIIRGNFISLRPEMVYVMSDV